MLRLIRSLIYYAVMVVILAFVGTIGWIIWLLEKLGLPLRFTRIHWVQGFNRVMTKVIAPVVLGLHYRVRGQHRLVNTPTVYMMKHQSAWETIASAAILPMHTWVLKRELLWIPLFGWGLRLTDPVPIERADPMKAIKAIAKEGKERIGSGISLVIFPEGTRMPPQQMGEFKPGGAFLAKQCKVRVVPIAHNAGHFWRKNSFLKSPGTITVVVGKPFYTDKMSASEINVHVERWMQRVQDLIER